MEVLTSLATRILPRFDALYDVVDFYFPGLHRYTNSGSMDWGLGDAFQCVAFVAIPFFVAVLLVGKFYRRSRFQKVLKEIKRSLGGVIEYRSDREEFLRSLRANLNHNLLAHKTVPSDMAEFLYAPFKNGADYGDCVVRGDESERPHALIFTLSDNGTGYIAAILSSKRQFASAVSKSSMVSESASLGGGNFLCSFKPIDTSSQVQREDIDAFIFNTQAFDCPYNLFCLERRHP